MIDAFGVEISKSGVGAGRYVRAIDMPKKIRTRQLNRLRAGKPQVASVKDQRFNYTRDNPENINFSAVVPKNKGTVIQTGRKKRTAELHDVGGTNIGIATAATIPNPRTNTNHILMPDKSKTKGIHGFLLDHEKIHAQLKPKKLAQNQFGTAKQKWGEEARADAMATLKTGKKKIPSDYVLANNPNYNKVYRKIVGRKPQYNMKGKEYKQMYPPPPNHASKSQLKSMYNGVAREVNSPSERAANGKRLKGMFDRPSLQNMFGDNPYLYNKKPNLP